MSLQRTIKAEVLKLKSASVVKNTFLAFAIAPLMGAAFVLMARNPGTIDKESAMQVKMNMLGFSDTWNSYFSILIQAVGVGGVLIFGFVASWLFGREYSDSTVKDLMALPVKRSTILNAKFIVMMAWCFCLTVSNFIVGALLSIFLDLSVFTSSLPIQLRDYFITSLLAAFLSAVIAFFAVWGKGYLAPLGFVGLTLVFAQVIAAVGYGAYFPWSIPGIFSGSAGEYKAQLNVLSYSILIFTAILGYTGTILYWNHADHSK
ncbi:MAG: ABC transporter permease [Bacteroidia bacterium]|nr:ABC transporter permease [Bacteroidia bacterium]